jgi:uncharacterized RDD family membrane protein YckC
LEATVTTPENPSPQDPQPPQPEADGWGAGDGEAAGESVDPHDALRGLEDRPRVDEQGFPTAYTAVPPPLNQQGQEQGQGQPGQGQGQGQPGRGQSQQGQGQSQQGQAQGQQGWRPPEPDRAAQSPQQQPPHYGRQQYGRQQPGYNGQSQYGQQQQQQPQYNGRPQYDQPAPQPTGAQAGYGAQGGGQDPYMQQGYGYPPPPPGYNEPYGSPYGGGPVPGMPPYASWGQRVGAWLIDNLVAAVGISLLDASYYDWSRGARAASWVIMVVGVVWALYNAYLAGKTGQSTGKRILGIRLARYIDGQVVGPGYGVLRLFMNAVFWAICIIPGVLNYLWPLWDRKSQTWSDKIASSVVVRAR